MNPESSGEQKQQRSCTEPQIIQLNVGGQLFSTTKSTLTVVSDTFFTSMLSGRVATLEDENGAKFIDRDPELFKHILHYLRTQQIDLRGVSLPMLRHEAQYYGITPLVKRLQLCEEMEESGCGDILYHGSLQPPEIPTIMEPKIKRKAKNFHNNDIASTSSNLTNRLLPQKFKNSLNFDKNDDIKNENDYTLSKNSGHVKKSSYDLTRQIKNEVTAMMRDVNNSISNPLRVRIIRAHNNSVAVAYSNFVACYKIRENVDWHLFYKTPLMSSTISHISLITKCANQPEKLAVALLDNSVHLWCFDDQDVSNSQKLGTFFLDVPIDKLFFIGNQLVALSKSGKVGIWHSMTQNWQVQDVIPISCYDTAGSVLLLGCINGTIYYIDMQKFPLRMKDNDLLITELYKDPNSEGISAVSIYLTPKNNSCGNWIEIAYGTMSGTVRVIVQHPETPAHGPQLFQTFTVHTSPITRVALTATHLISVCSEYNHVRTWSVTRFRGMISTQPGCISLSSFKILTLDSVDDSLYCEGCDFGPFGDQETEQLFIQRIVPDANTLFVRLASNGDRVCTVKSIDGQPITAFFAHESEIPNRMGSRPRRYLFTGTIDGSIQLWDLNTAIDHHYSKIQALCALHGVIPDKPSTSTQSNNSINNGVLALLRQQSTGKPTILQGPTIEELLQLIDGCELCSASFNSSPKLTPQSSAACLASIERNNSDCR